MRVLKKYARVYAISLQTSFQYREELIIWAIYNAVPLIAMVFLWGNIYSQNQSITGYDYQQIIQYYTLSYIISRIISSNFEEDFIDAIRTGDITKHFLKPFDIKKIAVIQEISWRSLNMLLIGIPVIIVSLLLFNQVFSGIQVANVLLATVFLLIAFIINTLISLIVLAIAFFLDQGKTISHAKWILEGIFSGSTLPLVVYPDWLQHLAYALPFHFSYMTPIAIMTQNQQVLSLPKLALSAITWISICMIIVKISWHFALRRFTAVGS